MERHANVMESFTKLDDLLAHRGRGRAMPGGVGA